MPSATIKSFTLNLNKVLKGNPKSVTMSCVYSSNGIPNSMAIGYVLAVDDTVTEIRCFNLGIKDTQSFMNTDKIDIDDQGGVIQSFRLGFSDGNGELKGFMMQGPDGDDIVATDNYEEDDQQSSNSSK